MEKIQIVQESGETKTFNLNAEVQNSLYLTTETNLINENIETFNIDIEMIPNQIAMKISQLSNFKVDENRKYQYLIGPESDLEKMANNTSDKFPEQIKGFIVEAYALTQKK